MGAKSNNEVGAQINTHYRLRDCSRMNGFRTVHHAYDTKQCKRAVDALKDEQKFLAYVGATECPPNMDSTRTNLFQSANFDKKISENRGNDHNILNHYVNNCSYWT